eukprot:CAMPEP_0201577434 /NCGR_PEP_ID=MMETSP0190_2-20130828/23843_1 /ASSEMBLY_ACC=CAM_ASM_000263 /TAXON_ID=37353 /ORGANISM="Rosalina sp." /LENGTH=66 /DNA_ID=CAMNT_0048009493 /DNA_START=9 /DNA_END=209 /DNA_ORIENTATION=-
MVSVGMELMLESFEHSSSNKSSWSLVALKTDVDILRSEVVFTVSRVESIGLAVDGDGVDPQYVPNH